MGILAVCGFSFSVYEMLKEGVNTLEIIKRSCDILTIVVPPALPTCMSIGVLFAVKSLKGDSIFCISPQRVTIAGKVNLMCFDKTGTLTEEGLDTHGVVVSEE